MEKTCTGCGETKPLEEYHKHKTCKYGRRAKCKLCKNGGKHTRKNTINQKRGKHIRKHTGKQKRIKQKESIHESIHESIQSIRKV